MINNEVLRFNSTSRYILYNYETPLGQKAGTASCMMVGREKEGGSCLAEACDLLASDWLIISISVVSRLAIQSLFANPLLNF